MVSGRCLCGGVRFRVLAPLESVQVCHCSQCRRAQGGPFATNIPVAASAFALEVGEDLLKAFHSSPGKRRVFCGVCGSPVYSARDDAPGVLRLRAGLLDTPLGVSVGLHFHTASRADWWDIHGDAPQLPGGR